jgi:Lrp/AsnC family leucine-responsive transcriptional regulator
MQKKVTKSQDLPAPEDFRIKVLKYLQEDASKTKKEMARMFATDQTTFGRHLNRIKSEGWISHVVAILDPRLFGKTTVAFVQFKMNDSSEGPTKKLVDILCGLDEVQEVHSVNGDYDLLAKVRVSDNEEVLKLIYRIETLDKNVIDTATMFTFCAHKETLTLKF